MRRAYRDLYDYSEDDQAYVIKVASEKYLDLFNRLDYYPVRRRDLSESVVRYLEDCSDDIPLTERVVLEVWVKLDDPSEDLENRVRRGLLQHFAYMVEYYRQRIRAQRTTSLVFTGYFVVLAPVSIVLGGMTSIKDNVLAGTLVTGIAIGSWVFLWEAIVGIVSRSKADRDLVRIYRRLSSASVRFRYGSPDHRLQTPLPSTGERL